MGREVNSVSVVIFAAVCLAGYVGTAKSEIPHVSECNFCFDCMVDDDTTPSSSNERALLEWEEGGGLESTVSRALADKSPKPPRPPKSPRAPASPDPLDDPSRPIEIRTSSYLATKDDVVPKQILPNCTTCRGCNTKLVHMNAKTEYMNRTYENERGNTASWLFRATTSRTKSGVAVAKVYCLPIAKMPGARPPLCAPSTILRQMLLLTAIERISVDCGLDDIIPHVWLDKVNSIVPDVGYHVRWHSLWMELVEGVSLENLLHKGRPQLPPEQVLDILHNKLNKTQVVRAAIFDLLTSQCDRHAQNIFVNEDGQIKLIDNEACLQNSWKNCGYDSILVPTTQKFEIVRLTNPFVQKLIDIDKAPVGVADPQVLLDYRCYIGKEELGTDYPPKVTQCLKKMSSMSVKEVQEHYGLPHELPAQNLKTRATDMLTKGFEWAYKFGEPRNKDPKRYRIQPKCCKVMWDGLRYRCAHEWKPVWEVPIGDPVTGREWYKPKPDTGTYLGGSTYGPE